jgi:aspartyl-tRNA(Asn)/glutamyl-tRNA(Gln) amidotransferase subunit A
MTFHKSLQEIQSALQAKTYSATELVLHYLDNIAQTKELNAFVHVYNENAIAQARLLDEKIKNNEPLGKLYGAVVSIKDNICIKDKPVSAASNILKGYISPYSATAINNLVVEGAIIIGSTNCDEFGMGSASMNTCYGPVKNGADSSLIAGGSSGGAAVSVQMDCCLCGIGSDTGGSIRQPASLCDVVGYKPTYGAVSRYGLIAYGSSFDQIGAIAHDIDTIKSVLDVIASVDEFDGTMMPELSRTVSDKNEIKIGVIPSMFPAGNSFTDSCKESIYALSSIAKINEVEFDYMEYLIPCYYILTTAEASSNLSRYDGVRYGHRSQNANNLEDMYVNSRSEGFGDEVKKRIMLGTFVLSEGYFDAYYTKAQKVRKLITDQFESLLQVNDVIAMPITPSSAWPLDKKIEDPIEIYLSDIYTVLANITGLPSISIPIHKDGKTTNIQLIGRRGRDFDLLEISKKLI